MSRRHNISDKEDEVRINISPMIDMVFILLIFFIVTTVFVEEEGIDVEKPTPASTKSEVESPPIMLYISKNGNIFHDEKEIGLSQVRTTVSRIIHKELTPVIIEVDQEVASGLMVRVMDEVKMGGAEEVSVSAASQ